MKTIRHLKAAIEKAGGRMEEDEGTNYSRCFQACAPIGRIWEEGVIHFRITWMRGTKPEAVSFNESEFSDLIERLSFGHREMTETEKELTADT